MLRHLSELNYLKLGAEARSRLRQARFTLAYDSRNSTELAAAKTAPSEAVASLSHCTLKFIVTTQILKSKLAFPQVARLLIKRVAKGSE